MQNSHDPNPKKGKRSTAQELEECLNNSFLAETQKGFQHPKVKAAIGRVSFAVQFEKSGMASVEEAEEAYSKAAAAIAEVLTLPEVQSNEESLHWLKVFDLHVNKHLHEIVLLADSNKKKPPAHYDHLEDENQQLKDEIVSLKAQLSELKSELDAYKTHRNALQTVQSVKVIDMKFPDKPEESAVEINIQPLKEKLDKATNAIQQIKNLDIIIRKHLEEHSRIQASLNNLFQRGQNALVSSNNKST